VNGTAAVETRRGHFMGRVYWSGAAEPDSGIPEGDPRRVLRAPCAGILDADVEIAAHVAEGQVIASIRHGRGAAVAKEETDVESEVRSPVAGVLRGLLRPGAAWSVEIGDGSADDPRCVSSCPTKRWPSPEVLEACRPRRGREAGPRPPALGTHEAAASPRTGRPLWAARS
jgi:hypothetical protein